MQSASSVNLDFVKNNLRDIRKESTESNNLSSLETKIKGQPMPPNKSERQNTNLSNLFSIYKLDGEYLDFDLDISFTKIQTESQFVEMFPLANGSNFLVVWNEEDSTKLNSNTNYTNNRPNNNYLDFPLSNQYNSTESVPLTTLLKLKFQFLDSVKDLANEKKVNSNNSNYKIPSKQCIKYYLPPTNIRPNENKNYNFVRKSCYITVEEKSDCIIADWQCSMLSLIDLIKFIIYLMLKLWIYKLSFGI
ncbi:hypothetical protein CONCODRAFT_70696 [Conidiobolus coronatus NRRL 28638]|uniref:Uncharacterized protein n=1 Tax=Conidiobolus coronatus (strain ATCC 28846 / CBS 209.66 / NRRL 28638) TaxID=796925 RepID=A0A137P5X8_CONC2|nr:hypothetical protein CONCODRAFT_70696 [Conidiobolus coronatus NRRL 28638]|eukprot:KXN70410.1 hypothetical protein CONCODRAFT_70696 [Conidiobolus coronatus NRRL 28638]